MESYESSVTAEQLEKALKKSVFSVNGQTGDVTLDAGDVGAVPLPPVAEVGQTIVVTAVNARGVPTAWETADFSAGGLPFSNIKANLIVNATVSTDEEGAYPARVEISQRDDGTPLNLKAFVLQTDVYSTYSYTCITLNDDAWTKWKGIVHNNKSTTNIFFLDADGRIYNPAGDYETAERYVGNAGVDKATYAAIEKITVPALGMTMKSGSFIKIWEIVEVED